MEPLEIIKHFAENGFTKKDLEKELYHNDELISFLEKYEDIPNKRTASAYHYIIEKDFDKKGTFLNIMNVFELILMKENVSFQVNTMFSEEYEFISDATPSWIPNHKKYISKLYDDNKPITKKEFKELLLENFKCLKKRPKWIQDADWIIDEKPLIFVGQIDVSPLYHDTTYLYMFFNPDNNTYENLTQSM